ncbi:hypothetical protein M2132_001996 [Dysgonomonas sp. PH5-45]|uniref:T9SS type A sorting domain-containing protein n=1 Tax=unclassified Dysgonomonas TaxID=2630389 RepID=UPI002475761A|nr:MULTISPECIES: T9SS type A sorting domain-containing protein [unclassified Dysgonomonas]MDH6355651.1 hypothetical protein [Dysgonomonas sp. PH5-45]MDH6388566.1 hypothetical protein [Dysgonomonas sp. PH5-37]
MRKLSTFLLLLAVFSYTVNGQGSFTSFKSAVNGIAKTQVAKISPDGTQVTGTAFDEYGTSKHMFTWTLEDGIKEWDANNVNEMGEGSKGYAITNTGFVLGAAPNPSILAYADAEYANGDSVFAKVITAAAANAEEWEFLPTTADRKNGGYAYGLGDHAYAISNVNNGIATAVGSVLKNGMYTSPIPVFWEVYPNEGMIYNPNPFTIPSQYTNGAATAIGRNGAIIGGWVGTNTMSVPALWAWYQPVEIVGAKGLGKVNGVSYNAAYAVMDLDSKGALYDIANKVLIYLQTEHNTGGCFPLAVSDNGIVVGHIGGAIEQGAQTPKTAFIYTEKMGLKKLADYLDEAGITYSGNLESVTSISADGTKLVGYGDENSFYIEIPAITEGAYPARGISLENKKYGEVIVNWTAGAADRSSIRTGYNIYHNGTFLATAASDATSYTHTSVVDGEHEYYVTAVYGETESRPTATASVMMAKGEFPFFDAFENYSTGGYMTTPREYLSKGGWDVSVNTVPTIDDSWISGTGGLRGNTAFFMTPSTGDYNEYMASPYLDMSNAEDAWLRFNFWIYGGSAEEFVAVEAFDGEEWVAIDTIACINTNMEYIPYKMELTEQLAGNANARFRFVAFGNAAATGGGTNIKIDNVDLYDTANMFPEDPVSAISATQWKNENDGSEVVYINWADPNGYARLRYLTPILTQWTAGKIGNDGAPFIAANMYPAEDLAIYDGYKLTSISFMPTTSATTAKVSATYKWFVSQGGERLFSADVTGDLADLEYTTIELDEPIDIDVNKPLYYGVEVVSHGMDDLPIATSDVYAMEPDVDPVTGIPTGMMWNVSYNVADGRGNIFSEDGGKTWEKVGSFMGDGGTEVYQIFNIHAEIMKDPTVEPKDRILGYSIYRNGEDIYHEVFEENRELVKLTTFIDTKPLVDQEATYEVKVEYFSQESSEAKEVKITFTPNSIENVDANGFITVTPTLAVNYVNIEGEFVKATMYDVNGKVVAETSNNQISVGSLPAGTYIVKVSTSKGEVTKKIIVKK